MNVNICLDVLDSQGKEKIVVENDFIIFSFFLQSIVLSSKYNCLQNFLKMDYMIFRWKFMNQEFILQPWKIYWLRPAS